MLLDFGLRYASLVGVASSGIWSPCLVVPGQDPSGERDGGICTRWIWCISPTHFRMWFLQNIS